MLEKIWSKVLGFLGLKDALRIVLEGIGNETARRAVEKAFFEEKGWDNEISAMNAVFAAQAEGQISASEAERIITAVYRLRELRRRFAENACIIIAGICGKKTPPAEVVAEIKKPDGTVVKRFRREREEQSFALLRWLARNENGGQRSQEEIFQLLRELGADNPYPYGVIDTVKEWSVHEGPSQVREMGQRIERSLFFGGIIILILMVLFIIILFLF